MKSPKGHAHNSRDEIPNDKTNIQSPQSQIHIYTSGLPQSNSELTNSQKAESNSQTPTSETQNPISKIKIHTPKSPSGHRTSYAPTLKSQNPKIPDHRSNKSSITKNGARNS